MVRFNLAVARACFVKCRGCYNHFSNNRDIVSVAAIRDFLRYCQEQTVVSGVTICGGDPLSRPDIVELVTAVRDLGIRVKLDTVGSAFLGSPELRFYGDGQAAHVAPADIVPLLGEIAVPLDGWSQESVELFRKGRPRLFEETLEILGLIGRFDTPIGVNTVVHQGNVGGLAKIEEAVGRFEVTEWQLFEYRPSGPLSFSSRKDFALEPGEFDAVEQTYTRPMDESRRPRLVTAKKAREVLPSRLVVDSNGLAWSHLEWVEPPEPSPGPRRQVAGNIQNPDDYAAILTAAQNCMDGRVQSEGVLVATGSHMGWRGPDASEERNES